MHTAPVNAIEFQNVSKYYGKRPALHEVSMAVREGECVALVGPNGAGKTTFMKIVLGVTRISAGTVAVHGSDPAGPFAAKQRGHTGYVPESVIFHDDMSGRELLRFYARLKGAQRGQCDMLLEKVGLAGVAGRRVRTYSKGMRQRLGLAQALLDSPRLLVLDEPTSGLDPSLRRRFYEILNEYRETGGTALVSSHALTEIEGHTDRIAVINQGRLAACGTLDELRCRARLPVRIRVSVTPGMAAEVAHRVGNPAAVHKVNNCTVELRCPDGEKMDMVRRIAGAGEPVRDVDIQSARLDQIYAHFTGDGELQ